MAKTMNNSGLFKPQSQLNLPGIGCSEQNHQHEVLWEVTNAHINQLKGK